MVVVGGGVVGIINRFFLYTTVLASASLLTAALIVEGVSFRVADLARSVIDAEVISSLTNIINIW